MLTQGDWVSLDAAQGEVFAGRIPTIDPDISRDRELATLLGWADETKRLGIRANADTPDEATRARAARRDRASACAAPSTCSARKGGRRSSRP